MKRHILFSILLLLVSISSAQENPERFKIKTGASFHRTALWRGPIAHVAGRLTLDYFVSKNVEVGIYGAYIEYKSDFDHSPDTPLATYGMELNYHFFPYLQKTKEHSWDLYISGKLGGYYAFFPETWQTVTRKHRLDYGAYLGLGYSFSNYLAPYLEIGYGELCIMELGLSFTF
ncbi:MAG: hypothetical protein DRI97_18875 [Bacteroidetes bacterium]|nr:MAG: hypothetical protein DRI97_18875 [Bacteroidota bacterium]